MSKQIVMKFGGSSVGNAEAIQRAASLIKATSEKGYRVVVVVSAMRGVTDILINAATAAAAGDEKASQEVKTLLWEKHHTAVSALLPENKRQVLGHIEAELSKFAHLVSAISVLGEVTSRGMDFISSLGERFSAMVMAAYLRASGYPAEAVMADEIIVTDDHFGNANPHLELTRHRSRTRLKPLLDQGKVVVVTGFMGATETGIVTTLGRGGSDYTASILGHALDADEIWIWSDVDGVLTADPRIVAHAHPIAQLSYQEAAELAYFGAKVLHPKTVRPAVAKQIPIRMLNTFNPDYEGTWIMQNSDGLAVKAVTSIPNLAEITVAGRGMLGVPGVAARLFGAVAQRDISILMISQGSSEQSICFVVREEESLATVTALEEAFQMELHQGNIERISCLRGVVIIAIVGAGMRHMFGIAGKLFTALGEKKINVITIAQGSSEYNLSLVVNDHDANRAVQAIHDAFELAQRS